MFHLGENMQTREEKLQALRAVTFEDMDRDPELEAELRALFFFFFDILMRGPNFDTEVTGCSFSQRGLNTLLVLKARVDGVPQVAYVTEKYPIGCVRVIGRQFLNGTVKWHLDRYAQT